MLKNDSNRTLFNNVKNKGYDKKTYPKLMLNILKVIRGPTSIYTPMGTLFKEASIEAFICASTK
jgi:hypothetical protein